MTINLNTKKFTLLLLAFLVLSSFFIGNSANAIDLGLSNAVSGIVGHIVQFLVWILGGILFVLIYILIWIAQYSDFIHSGAVTNGWVIVRDLCNMFFVLILLVIAFATILKIENYNVKKLLPKLLIMAVLINFSKTICGLIIDFSQVIMLTFVNGFKDMGSANLTSMLGIKDILKIDAGAANVSLLSVIGSYILALLYTIISVIVVLIIVSVLAMRIIMLWIYIVLSPLAFLLSAFPAGAKYASQWWSEFSKQVVVGPVLAFFIWLSFISIGANNADTILGDTPRPGDTGNTTQISSAPSAGIAEAGTPDNMIKFIISIGMLIGGLIVTQQMGGMAGAAAGKGIGWIRGGAARGVALVGKGALLPVKGGKALGSFGIDKLHEKTGVDLNLARAWKGMQEKRAEKRAERYAVGMSTAERAMAEGGRLHGALAMTGTPGTAWEQITSRKGIMQRLRGGEYSTTKRKKISQKENIAKKELKDLEKERASFIPQTEYRQIRKDIKNKNQEKSDLNQRIIDQQVEAQSAKGTNNEDKEKKKLDGLWAEQVSLEKEIENMENRVKSSKIVEDSDYKRGMSGIDTQITGKKKELESHQSEMEKYIPIYDFEARAAEQRVVSEKASKIKDITDGDELLRILNDAIKDKDKAMIKAITKKMTQNGDDNEFLRPLAGRTDTIGLQALMRAFSGKISEKDLQNTPSELKDYINQNRTKFESFGKVGFSAQEASALGSEISNINKGTNHWAATGGFKIKNGMWEETTKQEQEQFRSVESGKLHQQTMLRNLNRLAYGYHDEQNNFHIDEGGIMLLKKLDNPGAIKQIDYNMLESTAMHLKPHINNLRNNKTISKELADAIEIRAARIETDFDKAYEDAVNGLKKLS